MPTNVQPNSATILSIFPRELQAKRWNAGLIDYILPAATKDEIVLREYNPERVSRTTPAPRGLDLYRDQRQRCEVNEGYALVRVYDSFELVRDFNSENEVYNAVSVPALDIAQGLVTEWTSGIIGGDEGAWGIAVIPGVAPTPAELKKLRDVQTKRFRNLVNEGQTKFSKGELRDISDLHRMAAEWLGARDLPWVPQLEQVELKNCPACQNRIRKNALRCQHCNVDLPDFYRKYGILPDANDDPVVRGILDKMALAQKTKAA